MVWSLKYQGVIGLIIASPDKLANYLISDIRLLENMSASIWPIWLKLLNVILEGLGNDYTDN